MSKEKLEVTNENFGELLIEGLTEAVGIHEDKMMTKTYTLSLTERELHLLWNQLRFRDRFEHPDSEDLNAVEARIVEKLPRRPRGLR